MSFYIYQHRKKDTNEIFYVGKGSKNRMSIEFGRNSFWKNTVKKHGFYSEIVVKIENEELAYLAEAELIDKYKKLGIKLCNLTDGGIGGTGYVKSEKTRQLISLKNKGRKLSKDHVEKIKKANLGNKNGLGSKRNEEFCKNASELAKKRIYSESTRKKMSESAKNRKNRIVTEETKEKIRQSLIGKQMPEEVKKKISNTKRGIKNV